MNGHSLLPEAFHGWHQIQESLSRLTGLEFALYAEDATPLGMVSGESPFCRAIRRSGMDGSFCGGQCGNFIREACSSPGLKIFQCSSGQHAFAINLREECGVGLVIAGGKTFEDREEYEKAVALIRQMGGKVSLTGKHKYRFIGKRRLREVVGLVQRAAVQHFQNSSQKYAYQLKHNRHLALLENASLMSHAKDQPELAETLLRNLAMLFDGGCAVMKVNNGQYGASTRYEYGEQYEDPEGLGRPVEDIALRARRKQAEVFVASDPRDLAIAGLPESIKSVVVLPFTCKTEVSGTVCLINSSATKEDLPFLKAYIQQNASLLENITLRESVKERLDSLRKVVRLAVSLGSLKSPDEIFRQIFEGSVEMLRAERASLMLINDKSEELVIKLSKGLDREMMDRLKLKPGEGIAGRVAALGSPIIVQDIERDSRISMMKRPEYKTKSFISLPLKVDGRTIGVINLSDKISGEVFSNDDLDVLTDFADTASFALERAVLNRRADELKETAMNDSLTGLSNQRYFEERLAQEIDRSKRARAQFSVAIMDADDFGRFNMKWGSQAGDSALKGLSVALRGAVRANDIVGRLRDDKFAIIFQDTEIRRAHAFADRLRQTIADSTFGGNKLTVSIGISGYPKDGETVGDLLAKAFRAVSRAKELGKNRTVKARRQKGEAA
ncbi:MAG TPA: diguanylate cyclase [Nitrospirota bacterium]